MFISTITEGNIPNALINTMAFAEARLGVIANNVANASTPGYRAEQLDVRAFQASLRRAIDARGGDRSRPFGIHGNRQAKTGEGGFLTVNAEPRPVDNVLFHDGTNISIESEMADLAETGMAHGLAATLLRERFDGLRKAIRGTVG